MDTVSRELVGVIPAVTRDMTAESAAVGQEIRSYISKPGGTVDALPSATPPAGSGDNFGTRYLRITRSKYAQPIVWSGNEQVSVRGVVNQMLVDQTAQRIRDLVNMIEADSCREIAAAAIGAGNIVGTSTADNFVSDIKPLTKGLRVLLDNGAPAGNLQAVLNTADGNNLRDLKQLQYVDQSGDSGLLRQGLLGNLMGFGIRESAGYAQHTAGTGSGYLVNGAARAGDAEVAVDTGSGVFNAGDMVTFKLSDTETSRPYVVAEALASGGTVLKLVSPLQEDVPDNAEVSNSGDYRVSGAFDRSAVWLATRTIPVPDGGDAAVDRYLVSDPVSGLALTAAMYVGHLQYEILIGCAWGVGVVKPEHTLAIIGKPE